MFETTFKALGEPTRLRMVKLLAHKELCVCDLGEVMQISQPRISQHLKVLKYAGLVSERREGQRIICNLNRTHLNQTLIEFNQYINQPIDTIPELAGELSRMPEKDGEGCLKGGRP